MIASSHSLTVANSILLPLAVLALAPISAHGGSEILEIGGGTQAIRPEPDSGLWQGVPAAVKARSKWAFELGVGIIGDTSAGDWLIANFDRYHGDGEGYTYNLTVSRQIHEFDWRTETARFQPVIELPFMLTLVDQNEGGMVPDVNFGALFRWRDFPWNHHVYTTIGLGGGFSYAFDGWVADEQRHDGEDRSDLKFWMFIELTFAAPSHPEHQLTIFVDHQSGGHIFDIGGVEAWGIGYRYLF